MLLILAILIILGIQGLITTRKITKKEEYSFWNLLALVMGMGIGGSLARLIEKSVMESILIAISIAGIFLFVAWLSFKFKQLKRRSKRKNQQQLCKAKPTEVKK